jgi:biopolymer transport protein ExbD
MAELDTSGGGKKGGGKVRSKKASTRVDLTAMVDLAFLLITFFILTTTLQKPKAMDLTMPDQQKDEKVQLDVAESRTMTILVGKDNKVEWYIGRPEKPVAGPTVDNFGRNGLRKTLLEKSAEVKRTQGKDMIVIIKPSSKSTYENVVSVMDELNIVGNQIRAIQDISQDEIGLLQRDGLY